MNMVFFPFLSFSISFKDLLLFSCKILGKLFQVPETVSHLQNGGSNEKLSHGAAGRIKKDNKCKAFGPVSGFS